jgi:hypothetical protein
MSGEQGGIDFNSFWHDVAGNMDVTADDLLNMWTEFTRPGSVNILISDQRIISFTGDDIFITANIFSASTDEFWNVQLWAGPTNDDESGMAILPVYDTPLTNPDISGDLFYISYPGYDFGSGTVAQDAGWLDALYGGGGGGYESSWGSGGDWGTFGGGGGGWSGFGGGYNSYGVYSEDNIY